MAFQRVASFSDLREGGVVGVHVGDTPVALYRLGAEVFATHGVCTHALALLAEGWVEDGAIECPLHQGRFDIRTGKALCEPLTRDVKTYAVLLDNDDVLVDLHRSADHGCSAESEGEIECRSQGGIGEEPKENNRLVVIGAGQAAAAAIGALRSAGFGGGIALVGRETRPPYERPPLSKEFLLKADIDCTRLDNEAAAKLGVDLYLGVEARSIDLEGRRVLLDNGVSVSFDAVLFSTGGIARRLSVPGSDLPGVHHLRTMDDAIAIRQALGAASHVGIIGGGFIGLELASAARTLGIAVTLLEREPEIMSRLMPASVGAAFRRLAQDHGVDVRLDATIAQIVPRGRKLGIVTAADIVEVDAVLVGIGIEPDTQLAASIGCAVSNGIEVDREGRTTVPRIWAAGDCASRQRGPEDAPFRLESWHNAEVQGAAAGRSIAGATCPSHAKPPWFWTDQFGQSIQMVGMLGHSDRVVRSGPPDTLTGAVFRGFDPETGKATGIVAFSNPQSIREARLMSDFVLPDTSYGDVAAALPEGGERQGTTSEVLDMNMQLPVAITKRYVWPAEGLTRIPDWVYTDQWIYEREVEKIFHGKTWNFVALECEIPNPGDFIRSNVGPTSVIVSRAQDRSINVFENRCAHRAAEFCRTLSGNVKEFVCPYHQWTYDLTGKLAGVPFRRGVNGKGGMPPDFKTSEHGPRRLKVAAHRGVVFASYAEDVEPLAQYFGADILKEFEATFDGRRLKLLGYYRHTLPGNWKLYHENLRDPYHATLLHTFLVTFGLVVAGNKSIMFMDPSGRHGVMGSAKSDAREVSDATKKEMRSFKEGMTLAEPRFMNFYPEFDSPWSVTMSTIWPNLIVQREMNTLGIRHIVPTGPHEFIMKWTMFGFEGDDEEMTRHRLRQGNLMGPAGFLGLEDNEAIKFVQDGMQRVPKGEHLVKLGPQEVDGTTDSLISETAIRAMYQYWRNEMGL